MSGKMALQIPKGLWTAAAMVTLVVLSAPVAEGRDAPLKVKTVIIHQMKPGDVIWEGGVSVDLPPLIGKWVIFEEDFVYQFKGLCYYTNGTQRVRLVAQNIYNGEEYVRYDSDWGEHRAVTELGRWTAEYWNGQEDLMERRRAEMDTVCRNNYPMDEAMALHQRAEPTVTISPSRTEALNHHNMLVCSVTDFYPGQVKVRWFRNNQEETAGVVSTPLIRNGDWTFQILVMLEMTPQRGDVYTCHVEHPSRQSPIRVEWNTREYTLHTLVPERSPESSEGLTPAAGAQSESAQSKMLSGIGGFVLGLIFLGLGLFVRQRKQKGSHGPPPAGLLR